MTLLLCRLDQHVNVFLVQLLVMFASSVWRLLSVKSSIKKEKQFAFVLMCLRVQYLPACKNLEFKNLSTPYKYIYNCEL